MKPSILVTGAAGYIGSHAIRVFRESGAQVIAIDDLSTGNRWAVPQEIPFFIGDFADRALLKKIHSQFAFEAVVHFAAKTSVEESMQQPDLYRIENLEKTVQLARIAVELGVRHFIFSSTCAVYGKAADTCVDEETNTQPDSPYGATKLEAERALFSISAETASFKVCALRYFNVAGASENENIGQANEHVHSLVSVCADVLTGKRTEVVIHGTDYQTKDGTGVRDYIHVRDLADAHRDVLRYLQAGGDSGVFNCGYGSPYSVLDVVRAMEAASGGVIPTREGPRREGDIPEIFANSKKIRETVGWVPHYNSLEKICLSAYLWALKRPLVSQPRS